MKKYSITGGKKLAGKVAISGSKNVALKAIVAACLTSEKVVIHNMPLISDVSIMLDLVENIGGVVKMEGHSAEIQVPHISSFQIPLEVGAKTRTSTLFLAPLLARTREAIIPNPGGCRIGARPIDRIVEGLEKMNVNITYHTEDGYFHATTTGLEGATYAFNKNSHTGTETLILAAVLAKGTTVLENAAEEPEVDSLIELLNGMGANIQRTAARTIRIQGVERLHGTEFSLPPDRNEVVTFAVASVLTGGEIWIADAKKDEIMEFLAACEKAGVKVEEKNNALRFYSEGALSPTNITTQPHPGFMTDWQGVWALLMTQAGGVSTIHEAVYENRFGYKDELIKMGAEIEFVPDGVEAPEEFYNFNYDKTESNEQKIKIQGKTPLHNAVLEMSDLRAGATLVLAALIAEGASVIFGVEQVERGYEKFDERLRMLGADIESEEDGV